MTFRLGGYMVESNMGHIGDVIDPKAGDDPTIYGWRAAAESARFSKFVAAQVYGSAPHHSYVFGGSGGARRSPLCLAYAPDVWDAALPFMGDAMDGEYGDFRRPRTVAQHFCAMFNVQRLLGDKIYDVIDAMSPGGSGDPFAGLDTHQREELATLYRLGYPRGDEWMIAQPMGQIWLWSSMRRAHPTRLPRLLGGVLDQARPRRLRPARPRRSGPHRRPGHRRSTPLSPRRCIDDQASSPGRSSTSSAAWPHCSPGCTTPGTSRWPLELDDAPERLPAGRRRADRERARRRPPAVLHQRRRATSCSATVRAKPATCASAACSPGDEVHVDNHAFLAFCYYYRHHLHDCRRLRLPARRRPADLSRSTRSRRCPRSWARSTPGATRASYVGPPHPRRLPVAVRRASA